jgi:two-component system nitrate/nitrite response regulator NarL
MSAGYHVLILDGYALMRDILTDFLLKEPACLSAKAVPDVVSAIRHIQQARVSLVLLDDNLPGEPASAFMERLARLPFHVPVLVLSSGMNHCAVRRLLGLGAAGIVWNTSTMKDLSACVLEVARGATWKDSTCLERALGGAPRQLPSWAIPFSERQAQVLKGIAAAQANKEIAARLGVSETSVKCTVQQIFGKTGVRSRTELVRVVMERFPETFVPDMTDPVGG